MDAVTAHLQEFWYAYAGGLAVLLPLVYVTRRHTLPIVMWIGEFCIYSAIMHVVVHYFIGLVVWFKLNTTMYMNERTDPGWTTPLMEFWERAEYTPAWVFWFEIVFMVAMLAAMFKLRPMAVQKVVSRERYVKGEVPKHLRERYSGGGSYGSGGSGAGYTRR